MVRSWESLFKKEKHVAVPCRNRRLFCCVFQSHRCVRSTVSLNFLGGAYMCFVESLDIHATTKHVWAPPLTEVQRYGALNTAMRLKYVTDMGLPHTQSCHACGSTSVVFVLGWRHCSSCFTISTFVKYLNAVIWNWQQVVDPSIDTYTRIAMQSC